MSVEDCPLFRVSPSRIHLGEMIICPMLSFSSKSHTQAHTHGTKILFLERGSLLSCPKPSIAPRAKKGNSDSSPRPQPPFHLSHDLPRSHPCCPQRHSTRPSHHSLRRPLPASQRFSSHYAGFKLTLCLHCLGAVSTPSGAPHPQGSAHSQPLSYPPVKR